ncbi:GNAT family N-acetyltransferase [bacterium]|nr:MAG: GNAT family N-acetyltransferase [bacterium]
MAKELPIHELHKAFEKIRASSRIFVSTGCAEPQYLIKQFSEYVGSHPKSHWGNELLQVWTLGLFNFEEERFKDLLRFNTFFISPVFRNAVNTGLADYSPIFISQVPHLFRSKRIHVHVALIQTSLPDMHGNVSLGVSVDIVKAAIDSADIVIAQMNQHMPEVWGDGFISMDDIDFAFRYDEPILQIPSFKTPKSADKIGEYLAQVVKDGDTIQAGYGRLPNFALRGLSGKKNLGLHSELLSPVMVELMKKGVINNSQKSINRGKSIASFCIGNEETYRYIHKNPTIEFREIDYVNQPLVIARNNHMTAINTALEIDLTGQATTETLDGFQFSGIGGITDFMRGATLNPDGKNILVLESTAKDETLSRIVPFLREGTGVTLGRGDIHYVITEYGIAYLHGKNFKERALELISIAHPKFRDGLFTEGKARGVIPPMVDLRSGINGIYPEKLITKRFLPDGSEMLIRPVKITDERLIKSFFAKLSDKSMKMRFTGMRIGMKARDIQHFVDVDYRKHLAIIGVVQNQEHEEVIGLAQYVLDESTNLAEFAITTSDSWQRQGIGFTLASYLKYIAMERGIRGFTASALVENKAVMALNEKLGTTLQKQASDGVYEIVMLFKEDDKPKS